MKLLIFLAPKNFKDETVATLKTFLDKWNVGYSITSFTKKECIGYHGATYTPEVNTGSISPKDYDGIVFVDGRGIDEYKLYEFRPLLDLVLQFNNSNKMVGAINNSIKIAARANIIMNKKVSMPDDDETKRLVMLFRGIPSNQEIEIAGNLVTMNGKALDGAIQAMLQNMGVI